MIKIYDSDYSDNRIISLWQECFGDSAQEVQLFLDKCKNKKCLTLEINEALASMLFLVDCTVNGQPFSYIYAACTAQSYRRQGLMKSLLDYSLNNFDRVLLVPADEKLVDYYYNRGFQHKIDIKSIIFNECQEIKEYLFEGCELEAAFALSNSGE